MRIQIEPIPNGILGEITSVEIVEEKIVFTNCRSFKILCFDGSNLVQENKINLSDIDYINKGDSKEERVYKILEELGIKILEDNGSI